MGKQSKNKKKLLLQQQVANAHKVIQKPSQNKPQNENNQSDSEDEQQQQTKDYISKSELMTTIQTIRKIGKRIQLFKSVEYKPLRAALHPLFEEKIQKEGTDHKSCKNLSNSITSALFDGRFDDAIYYLEQYSANKFPLKLGTVMRWVRDVNLNTINPDPQNVRALYAILRCYPEFQGQVYQTQEDVNKDIEEVSLGKIIKMEAFSSKELLPQGSFEKVLNTFTKEDFHILLTEKADDRKPPNQYDLDITMTNKPLQFPSQLSEVKPIQNRVDVPWVPGSFVINNVLSPQDCQTIVNMAETMGFKLDIPIGSLSDFRAHGCVWLADEQTNNYLFERAKPFFDKINGKEPVGINARWRIYRYNSGNVYRPHIDGAWPGSGKKGDDYLFDSYGDRYSRLTLVYYLSEGFQGGATTFYTPSREFKGCIDQKGVAPRIGSLLAFPHGEQAGALIHEGSEASDGVKYIIRSDLLYLNEDIKQ